MIRKSTKQIKWKNCLRFHEYKYQNLPRFPQLPLAADEALFIGIHTKWRFGKNPTAEYPSTNLEDLVKKNIIGCSSRDSIPTLRVRFSNFNFVLELKCRNLSTDHAVPLRYYKYAQQIQILFPIQNSYGNVVSMI